MYFPSGHSPIREDVPIPPFHPKHVIPVPAPIAPSSIFGEYADEIAFITWWGLTCLPRMSFK